MTGRFYNLFIFIVLGIFLCGCGPNSGKQKKQFELIVEGKVSKIAVGTPLVFQVANPENRTIDSVSYVLNGQQLQVAASADSYTLQTTELPLGNQRVIATIYYEGTSEKIVKDLTILNDQAPKLYTYKVVNSYPHDIGAFTQGLEFSGDTLIESTGHKGKSTLRKVNYKTGKPYQIEKVPNEYFAEGVTIWKDKIIQLTWNAGVGFIYNKETLQKTGSFTYNQSKEGWGLCNDGRKIYKSDGTEKIWILNPETLAEERFIQITTNKGVKTRFNELEWVNDKIYANTWQKDGVAIINPKNGALEGVINFSGLREQVTQHPDLDVLNGIAYKTDTKQLFLTGKNWDKIFEIEIVPR